MATLKLNQLPAPTFSWLGVNHAEAELDSVQPITPDFAVPEGVSMMGQTSPQDSDQTALASYLSQNHAVYYAITGSSAEPVHIQIPEKGAAGFRISAQKNQQLTVIMQVSAEDTAIHTEIQAAENTNIKLVQIFAGEKTVTELSAQLADCAALELVQLYPGGRTVSGISVAMNGRKSAFTSSIGYLLDHDDLLDMNLNIIQNGKKSESATDVKGVLRGHAKKIFRGTIDFRQGAEAAKGAEREDVLLMDETVQNKTVPVILCAEEDVEGSHGASIGQLDADHIFYLQSRGIPTDQIYEMMAQSKLGSVIRQIGDAQTERAVNRMIGKEEPDASQDMEG